MHVKYVITTLLLTLFSFCARSECQLISSQQSVSYGVLSAAERQAAEGDSLTLPVKYLQLNVSCDEPQRVRLFFDSTLPRGTKFAFGDQGVMEVSAMKAVVDDREVNLTTVQSSNGAPMTSGRKQIDILLNEGIAFVNHEEEARGKNISLTLAIRSHFRNQSVTERVKYSGNLQVRVDAQ